MALTVYGYRNNPRTRLVRIVAEAADVHLDEVEVIPRMGHNRDLLLAKFPLSAGKIPALEGPDIRITETIAIAAYLARLAPTAHLLGDGSPEQEAQVLSWASWANQELLGTLARWFLPLIPNLARPAPYDAEAVAAGKADSLALLDALETAIGGRITLVCSGVTLADFFVAVALSRGLEWVLDDAWRSRHPNCMAHFGLVSRLDAVRAVVPEFVLVPKEPRNMNPYSA